MAMRKTKIVEGDWVRVEVTAYDRGRGRITAPAAGCLRDPTGKKRPRTYL
jgi:hypothetical protein